ncbi:hypothetical protein [Streptomyces sp. enrichment culture]|uniref:hypothetical protein n=1 Tax=Streptomyces sp. enrichment culture TaxID=1795815 RepID=UPI003F5669C6
MTATDIPERLTILPVRVRPVLGETVDSYVHRLALANHLSPSYLHGFLNGPPFWQGGKPRLDRLAILAGYSQVHLARSLVDPTSLLVKVRPAGHDDNEDAQAQLFLQIRRFAEGRGLPLRRVAARFGVSRATVRRALNAPEPSPEHVIRRRPPTVIEPIQVLIDPMIDAGLLPKQIWDRLYDEHGIAVTTLMPISRYVHRRRASSRDARSMT